MRSLGESLGFYRASLAPSSQQRGQASFSVCDIFDAAKMLCDGTDNANSRRLWCCWDDQDKSTGRSFQDQEGRRSSMKVTSLFFLLFYVPSALTFNWFFNQSATTNVPLSPIWTSSANPTKSDKMTFIANYFHLVTDGGVCEHLIKKKKKSTRSLKRENRQKT